MEEFLKAVSNFGFPIVVAAYLLIRQEGKLVALTNEIRDLKEVIKDLCQTVRSR
jgi:hypothetical protein